MSRLKENNTNELKQLFKEYHQLLCLISFGITKNQETAKDIVQDFFIAYWQKKATIVIAISFKAYAIRAVKNLSLKAVEKEKKKMRLVQELEAIDYEEEAVLLVSNRNEKVQYLLNQLPESRKQIFISAIVNGQSYAEIAKARKISVNTVKTQIKRAYAFLRAKTSENVLSNFLWFIITTFTVLMAF